MITLGIECSSRQGSLALLKDGVLLTEKTWIADRVRHNVIFKTLECRMNETEISYSDISLFVVGRGPGSFSGMRMSFSVARALALPGHIDVLAVSSGAALALAVAREGAEKITVVGDARRGQVWIGCFQSQEKGAIGIVKDWELIPYEDVLVSDGAGVVSPEAERLSQLFPNIVASRFPHATDVAELALTSSDLEPFEPLYMHPPVFIEPKYS